MRKSSRIISFDVLRAIAMMAGIFFHGALPYMKTKSEWALFDFHSNEFFDIFAWSLHRVRIPIFFIISGYLAQNSVDKKGSVGFLSIRFKKIFIPFVASYLIIIPLIMKVVEVIRDSGCHGSGLSTCLLGISNPYTIQNIFTTETLHLWFLYYLFIYQLLFYAYRKLTLKTPNYRKTNITLFILLVISQILMKSWTTTNSSSDLIIDPVSFLYYGIFFFWGSVLAKQDIDKTFNHFQGKRFIALSVALLLITPLFFLFKKLNPNSNILGLLTPVVALCSIVFSISTIGIIFNLTLRTIKSASPVISYLLDSSYWIYLWHIIPLILLQSLVNDLDYFIAAKYLFVTISSLIIMIIFYHLFARFTPIGTFLHGKRPAVTNRV